MQRDNVQMAAAEKQMAGTHGMGHGG